MLPPPMKEMCSTTALAGALRDVLREAFWCRFEAADAFIHVGWDYYMYVGVPDPALDAQQEAKTPGVVCRDLSLPRTGDGF